MSTDGIMKFDNYGIREKNYQNPDQIMEENRSQVGALRKTIPTKESTWNTKITHRRELLQRTGLLQLLNSKLKILVFSRIGAGQGKNEREKGRNKRRK
jgi:hypothetical protein